MAARRAARAALASKARAAERALRRRAGRARMQPVGHAPRSRLTRGAAPHAPDRYLPIANISRIMKRALPANAKIAKDAKETVQECVSEFISFITSECVEQTCRSAARRRAPGAPGAQTRLPAGHPGVTKH